MATTYTAVAAGGNWTSAGTWDVGSGYPVAGDTAIINATMTGTVTVNAHSACEVLNLSGNGGTFALGNYTLTCGGNITLDGNFTYGSGKFAIFDTVSLTTNNKTIPKIDINATLTLADNCTVSGLVTMQSSATVNKTSTETITCNGGLTIDGTPSAGTATFIVAGGTIQSSASNYTMKNPVTINTASTVTIGTNYYHSTGALSYVSGTVITAGSTLYIGTANTTIDTGTVGWNNIYVQGSGVVVTLSSNLLCTGTLTLSTNATFSGSGNIYCSSLRMFTNSTTSARTYTFVSGSTVVASGVLNINGTPYAATNVVSATPSSPFYLNYIGDPSNCQVFSATITDCHASGSAQSIDNWYGGTLTRTSGIINRTSADLNNIFGVTI